MAIFFNNIFFFDKFLIRNKYTKYFNILSEKPAPDVLNPAILPHSWQMYRPAVCCWGLLTPGLVWWVWFWAEHATVHWWHAIGHQTSPSYTTPEWSSAGCPSRTGTLPPETGQAQVDIWRTSTSLSLIITAIINHFNGQMFDMFWSLKWSCRQSLASSRGTTIYGFPRSHYDLISLTSLLSKHHLFPICVALIRLFVCWDLMLL